MKLILMLFDTGQVLNTWSIHDVDVLPSIGEKITSNKKFYLIVDIENDWDEQALKIKVRQTQTNVQYLLP